MMIQLLLTAALLLVFVYAFIQHAGKRLLRIGIYVLCCAGFFMVWLPGATTEFAHAVGVGRGTDLITYLWIMLSFMVAVNLHVKLTEGQILTTHLARWLAIEHAIEPPK